ncbi:MAG: hypothetical protein WCT23_01315 [Candidatus Neomarinimicrobiota bacterium]
MRLKTTSVILSVLLALGLFAQEKAPRKDFFKSFYGTYFSSSGIEIPQDQIESGDLGLKDVIKQLEARYNIDIPAEEEAKFNTVEDVVEYVNKVIKESEAPSIPKEGETSFKASDTFSPTGKVNTWVVKVFASYGLVEPAGLTGDQGWDGNLFGVEAFNVLDNMYTNDIGVMFHPFAISKKASHIPYSLGLAFDYASFNHWGPTSAAPRDTTASRWGISLIFQQDLTGRKKTWSESGIYIQESIKVSVHDYGYYDDYLQGDGYVSFGLGLTQGAYVSIFDIKFYQTVAYSPGLHADYPALKLFDFSYQKGILDFEMGIRVGIALRI